MRGKIQYKNGIFEICYKHKSPGRDNRGFEKWSWRTNIYKILYIGNCDLTYLIGCKVKFNLKFEMTLNNSIGERVAVLDSEEINKLYKSKVRDYKINRLINE